MKREIKFRVWRTDLKRFLHYHELYVLRINPLFSLIWNGQTGVRSDIRFEIFQQYTGLKDKNGKEIYEGDTLKGKLLYSTGDLLETRGEVIYNSERTCFDFNAKKIRTYLWMLKEDIEVIGNIFETPELLK